MHHTSVRLSKPRLVTQKRDKKRWQVVILRDSMVLHKKVDQKVKTTATNDNDRVSISTNTTNQQQQRWQIRVLYIVLYSCSLFSEHKINGYHVKRKQSNVSTKQRSPAVTSFQQTLP
jgi:hypothetical protein